MNKFTKRMGVGAAIALGTTALVAGVSFAAAPFGAGTADDSGATGTAAGIPGVVEVNKSYASRGMEGYGDSGLSIVSVGGQSLLGRDASSGWTGPLAALGPVVDAANAALCPSMSGIEVPGVAKVCAQALPYVNYTQYGNAFVGADLATVIVEDQTGALPAFTAAQVAPTNAASYGGCAAGGGGVAGVHSALLPDGSLFLGMDGATSGCDIAR